MRNINHLEGSTRQLIWLVVWLGLVAVGPGCRATTTQPDPAKGKDPAPAAAAAIGPALPLDRIAIVGASVSAGFGGLPFGDAFTAAAPRSKIDTAASTFLFRDPIGDTRRQLAQARSFGPTVLVALDLLFWDVYGSRRGDWQHSLELVLGELETLRQKGTWIILGDIPLITTASELMLPKDAIPDPATLASANDAIRAWSTTRDRVLLVPLVEWTEPLRAGTSVELAPGENVEARTLMALDGLHANPLGTWYLLTRLDRFIEEHLPGTPKNALTFIRP